MKKIGRYIIRGLLGRGGMGKIFKVELPGLGKIAALKLLDPDPLVVQLMGLESLRSLFIHEAVTMANLNHPNIVAVHDLDEHDGKPFFVMDYFANNLGVMIGESYIVENPSRPILVDKALDYTLQTLNGLDCLHDAGILHRDIKPFNLLVTTQDRLKICDFGLSKLRNETFAGPGNLNVGSPYYAAPEQEDDPDSVDMRADLYSVGVMLYRMLTGRLPISNSENSACNPPSRINRDLDHKWDDFINMAIARRPQERFSNAGTMIKSLLALRAHWEEQKDNSCAFLEPETAEPHSGTLSSKKTLRHKPLKLSPKEATGKFNLDSLWRPETYGANQFEIHDDTTALDRNTGLVWQISGTGFPRPWNEAHLYIKQLNDDKFGGFQSWRIPTIEELITLLKPNPQGTELCIEPVFDNTQRWIWSVDRRSFVSAYYIDLELGFVGWQDFSAPYYVKAVSSI